MARHLLFSSRNLNEGLEARLVQVRLLIDQLPEDQFRISSDEELIEFVVAQLQLRELALDLGGAKGEQRETQIDVSGDRDRVFSPGRTGPFFIPGTELKVRIPFSGSASLFEAKPSSYTYNPPAGEIERDHIVISISKPHDADPEAFKGDYEREKAQLVRYIEWTNNDVRKFNNSIREVAQRSVSERRKRLEKHQDLAQLLNISIEPKEGAPSVKPVTVSVRKPPQLPVPPKGGLKPEPGIQTEVYETILQFIRHQGRTFERAPQTFSKHDEEGLRDIILAQLNGHFRGSAGAEVFRRKGKTDICIEEESRSAFVGECKIWKGPKEFAAAIDQLLSYLTWRDSKAALIAFNTKNQDFSNILAKLPEAARAHPFFLKALPCSEEGEWRFQMRSEEDPGRTVTVHVFAFNIFSGRQ